jgi:hypothetical protein
MKFYYPHITFFIVFMVAAVPVLYYYQRKNPHPRFRPGFGEMAMVTVMAVMLCGGMAFGLGSLFRPENDGTALKKAPDRVDFNSGGEDNDKSDSRRSKTKEKDTGDLSGGGFKRGDD